MVKIHVKAYTRRSPKTVTVKSYKRSKGKSSTNKKKMTDKKKKDYPQFTIGMEAT
jgi:hypothetical protein|tara:strand:+ start:629 stop:793 length:165 start_codon:yes stop_codon:yes gene_type:complete